MLFEQSAPNLVSAGYLDELLFHRPRAPGHALSLVFGTHGTPVLITSVQPRIESHRDRVEALQGKRPGGTVLDTDRDEESEGVGLSGV
jgi:hypothetical protein